MHLSASRQKSRPLYPDLTTVKLRRTPAREKHWLAKPEVLKPGTFMANFHEAVLKHSRGF